MKNIHVLSTTQDSWLCLKDGELVNANDGGCMLGYDPPRWLTQHIYITSDEEIKEGDWYLDTVANVLFKNDKIFLNGLGYKKIILTTDQDLIKDGVQAIDDEFLEYYVSVPFGEIKEVEVDDLREMSNEFIELDTMPYKIIIPKEETKQDKIMERFIANAKQQETLEETAERISPIQQVINFITENFQKEGEPRQLTLDLLKKWCEVKLLNEESKWQQEKSYSEEEVLDLLNDYHKKAFAYTRASSASPKDWFEQFKKK